MITTKTTKSDGPEPVRRGRPRLRSATPAGQNTHLKESRMTPFQRAAELVRGAATAKPKLVAAVMAVDLRPLAVPIPTAAALTGISVSQLYVEAAAGRIAFRKIGRRSLVDFTSLRHVIDSLPLARPDSSESPPPAGVRTGDDTSSTQK
jgi:hypothetical protein